MEKQVSEILEQMAKSHDELSRILHSTREIAVHLAVQLVNEIPNENASFRSQDAIMRRSLDIAVNVTSYLNSIGDLQEALAENLEPIIEGLQDHTVEE